jgi:hypothetical protein
MALLALAGCAAFAAAAELPRGDDRFRLGMTRDELQAKLQERGVEPISKARLVVATTSDDPAVEYERYLFVPATGSADVLAEVTLAYRLPFNRTRFDAVMEDLLLELGEPNEHVAPGQGMDQALETLTWTDGRVAVRLGARWTEQQDPRSDRMIVTWTDLRMRQAIAAALRPPRPKQK